MTCPAKEQDRNILPLCFVGIFNVSELAKMESMHWEQQMVVSS